MMVLDSLDQMNELVNLTMEKRDVEAAVVLVLLKRQN